MTERVLYRVAGGAERQAIGRAIAAGVSRKALRALLAVFSLTTTYSKLEDNVTHGRIANLAGLHPSDVGKALAELAKCGAIGYRPGKGGRYSQVAIPVANSAPPADLTDAGKRHDRPASSQAVLQTNSAAPARDDLEVQDLEVEKGSERPTSLTCGAPPSASSPQSDHDSDQTASTSRDRVSARLAELLDELPLDQALVRALSELDPDEAGLFRDLVEEVLP